MLASQTTTRVAGSTRIVMSMNATVSQTQTGVKSVLLKPFDPLFRKGGAGTRLVIKVAGTQDQPKVGVDIGRTLKGKKPNEP